MLIYYIFITFYIKDRNGLGQFAKPNEIGHDSPLVRSDKRPRVLHELERQASTSRGPIERPIRVGHESFRATRDGKSCLLYTSPSPRDRG